MKRRTIETIRAQRVAVLPLEVADGTTVLRVPNAGVSIEALERALIVFARWFRRLATALTPPGSWA